MIKQIVASHEPSVKVIKHDEDKEEVNKEKRKQWMKIKSFSCVWLSQLY